MPGEASLQIEINKSVLDLMTERLHLPPFPLAFDPILFHYVQVLMAASFQFSCVGKSWSVPMTRGGRW